MKKIVVLIMDGLGDRPNSELMGLTPLQYSFRPNMNTLARKGQTGFMFPVSEGVCTGSDTSHLSILGYDPRSVYTGRGPFEAMGLGLLVNPGDIAFRANFATVDASGVVTDRRAGRIRERTAELASELSFELDGYKFTVAAGVEHRAALVVSGPDLSDRVSDSDPHEVGRKVKEIKALDESGERTAEILNRYTERARAILEAHDVNVRRRASGESPANIILLRGAGKAPEIEPFARKWGMKGACIAGIPLIRGIGHLAGLDIIHKSEMTGSYNSDYRTKIRETVHALRDHDFVLVNFKATDVAGHDGEPFKKVSVIEKADEAISPLLDLGEEITLAITGDHSTPCAIREHSGDPVPLLIYTDGIRADQSEKFDEIQASHGSIRIRSGDLMQYLLSVSDRAEKYGA